MAILPTAMINRVEVIDQNAGGAFFGQLSNKLKFI